MALESTSYVDTPGFQGSETSGVEVTLYPHGNDPVLVNTNETIEGKHRGSRAEDTPKLVSVSTNKPIDGGAGTWEMAFKPASNRQADTFFQKLADDDWVDIVMFRHGQRWHVMRGLVDSIRRSRHVGGTGSTTESWVVSGQDFQKPWMQSQLWFDRFTLEDMGGSANLRIIDTTRDLNRPPDEMVQIFLDHFLNEIQGFGRANWNPPPSVPGIATSGSFADSIVYYMQDFLGVPARRGVLPGMNMPNGNLWSLAKEWSDPNFCELFVDLLHHGKPAQPMMEHPMGETSMGVIFRDRPFPLSGQVTNSGDLGTGSDSAWFKLPTAVVPRQQIVSLDVGRGGTERFNAFFVNAQLGMELAAQRTNMLRPLWHPVDIRRHGLRRFDIASKYVADQSTLLTMTETQRYMVRDWHALNAYLLAGSLDLGVGRPDIRVGMRALVPGPNSADLNETYYVEQVSHNWTFGPGLRTSLGVTRGWIGTDNSLLEHLDRAIQGYTAPTLGQGA